MLSNETGKSMELIDTQVEEILEAIAIIDEISFQTNTSHSMPRWKLRLLGEAGEGFAVVAQEIRNLASKSADAARSIKEKVENATELTQTGKNSSMQTLQGYQSLKNKITETTEEIAAISRTIQSHHRYIEEIYPAMQSIRQSTQNNRQIAHKTEEIVQDTNTLSADIVTQSQKSQYDPDLVCTQECSL